MRNTPRIKLLGFGYSDAGDNAMLVTQRWHSFKMLAITNINVAFGFQKYRCIKFLNM